MNNYNPYGSPTPPPYRGVTVEQQTNSILKRVYVRMFIGLLVSAFVALGVASSQAALAFIFGNKIVFWGILIGMLAIAFILPARMQKMSSTAVFSVFLLYCVLIGAWLSSIFLIYKITSIVTTFFVAAGTFGAMSVYGYFTKANLAKVGSLCIMALFGLIIAMLVNLFIQSTSFDKIISVVGVLIFVGLTAWDTQQVKALAAANLNPDMADKLATMGAMSLYLDFINLFLFLLRLFGASRD